MPSSIPSGNTPQHSAPAQADSRQPPPPAGAAPLARAVVQHPRLIVMLTLLLTLFFALGIWRNGLQLDVSPDGFVERHSQARDDYEAARRNFGADEFLVVAVIHATNAFAPAEAEKLRALHQRIAALPGVLEVLSLANAPYARSTEDGAEQAKLMPANLQDVAALAQARQIATTDRLFQGNLVAPDAHASALNISLDQTMATEARHALTAQIYHLAKAAGFAGTYFGGGPFSQWRSTLAVKHDLQLFLPLTLLLIATLLWLSFRSLVGTVLPLLTIGLGLLWLLGAMAWLKVQLSIIGMMLPTLMLAIGCSYLIHVVNQIGIEQQAQPAASASGMRDVIARAMAFINLPVLVSALTIIAGFLSLAFTKIPAVRETALFAALGAAFTMLLSLTFVPAMLVLLGQRVGTMRVALGGQMVQWLAATGRWATDHQRLLFVVTALIAIVSLLGVRRILINIDYLHFFKANSETTIGLDEINRRLAGTVVFDVIVEAQRAGELEDPQTLERIAQLQNFIERDVATGGLGLKHSLSVADFIKHVHRAFNNDQPQYYSIPAQPRILRELLADRDQLKNFLAPDGRVARILVRCNLTQSSEIAATLRAIEAKGKELLPQQRVFATGTFVLLNRTSDQIAGEQVQSIALALLTIFVMLSLLFRSARVGFTALVPNLIPVLFFFGFMGWRGIPLNLTTSLVASVVLGLAVDNAVQFIVRFRRVQASTPDLRAAIIESMRLSGRPIIYANIALAATFAIFALSEFEPISSFGLLSAITILGCLVEDLVLLPSRLTSPIFRAK